MFQTVSFVLDPSAGLAYLQGLNLERIVMCQLNPLRVCLSAVTNMFAAITRYSTRDRSSDYKTSRNKSITNEGIFTHLLAGSTSSSSVTPSLSETTGTCCQWWAFQRAATLCPLTQTFWIPSSLLIRISWKGNKFMLIPVKLSLGMLVHKKKNIYLFYTFFFFLQQLWKTHWANLPGVGRAVRLYDRCAQEGSEKGDTHSQWPQRIYRCISIN